MKSMTKKEGDNIKLTTIPDIFYLLLNSDEKIKLQTAEVLNQVVSEFNSNQLVKMDKVFRERTSYEWSIDWRDKNPNELLHLMMSEEERIVILGLCSFHPNGYFREKAICALANMKTGQEIPYILIRVNDWVEQIRNTTKEKLLEYIKLEYAMDFVNSLPLVLRLKECSRNKNIDIIVDKIISLISSPKGGDKLIVGLQSGDPKVRLACYKIILETKKIDNRSILNYVINDKDSYNRLFILRKILSEITKEELDDIYPLLVNDNYAQIRRIGLELLYNFSHKDAFRILEKSLFDSNASVRELSRFLLSKSKKYDFATIYRDSIQKNEKLYSSICGLGETGNINDTKFILKFVDSEVVKIVKASINALSSLDMEGNKEKILQCLSDDRPGISKVARKVLYKNINDCDVITIDKIFREDKYDHVKINASILLCSLSKWNAIIYIIELCSNKNEEIAKLGQRAFESWKQKYNQSFTTPTYNQIQVIKKVLMNFGDGIGKTDREFIEFSIKDFC